MISSRNSFCENHVKWNSSKHWRFEQRNQLQPRIIHSFIPPSHSQISFRITFFFTLSALDIYFFKLVWRENQACCQAIFNHVLILSIQWQYLNLNCYRHGPWLAQWSKRIHLQKKCTSLKIFKILDNPRPFFKTRKFSLWIKRAPLD